MAGTIAFIRRRRRGDEHRKSETSLSGNQHSQMTVTPFTAALVREAPREAGLPIGVTSDGLLSSSEPTLASPQSAAPIPVGLTGKELAQLRSTPMLSPPTHPRSSSSGSRPTYPPTISTTDQTTVTLTPETRRLQTEVESLRREMQQLRAERFEPPPSYPPSYGYGGGV
jgi:hypothetical protein